MCCCYSHFIFTLSSPRKAVNVLCNASCKCSLHMSRKYRHLCVLLTCCRVSCKLKKSLHCLPYGIQSTIMHHYHNLGDVTLHGQFHAKMGSTHELSHVIFIHTGLFRAMKLPNKNKKKILLPLWKWCFTGDWVLYTQCLAIDNSSMVLWVGGGGRVRIAWMDIVCGNLVVSSKLLCNMN